MNRKTIDYKICTHVFEFGDPLVDTVGYYDLNLRMYIHMNSYLSMVSFLQVLMYCF